MENETQEKSATAASGTQTNPLLLAVLAAAVVVPIVSSLITVSSVGKKIEALKTQSGEGENKSGEEKHSVKTAFYQPMEFLVNLADTASSHYLRATVSLGLALKPETKMIEVKGGHGGGSTQHPEAFEKIKTEEPAVRDIIISTISGYTLETLTTLKGKEELKEALRNRLQTQLGLEDLSVFFTAFTLQ